jgi:hypothetical protein
MSKKNTSISILIFNILQKLGITSVGQIALKLGIIPECGSIKG